MCPKLVQKLSAAVYLKKINDKTKLSKKIIMTPLSWMVDYLAPKKKGKVWVANKARIIRNLKFGKNQYDLVITLPGASMSMITAEEACQAGSRAIVFIGTGGSISGKRKLGEAIFNPRSISVLNPYAEHRIWNEIKNCEVVDMESQYIRNWAKGRKIKFDAAIMITDAIWRNHWEYGGNISRQQIGKIKEWLAKI